MKIKTKLLINTILPVATSLLILSLLASSIHRNDEADRTTAAALSVLSQLHELNQKTYNYLLSHQAGAREDWFATFNSLSRLADRLRFANEEQNMLVGRMRRNLGEMRDLFNRKVIDDRATHDRKAGLEEGPDGVSSQILARTRLISADAYRLYQNSSAETARHTTHSNRLILVLLIGSVLITLGTLIPINSTLSRSLSRLTAGAGIVGAGNLEHRIGITAHDEIGQLARAFDAMTGNLKEITVSRDELSREIAERKRAEEALRRSEAILKQAGQMAHLGAWEIEFDHDGPAEGKLRWGDEVYRIFGYEPGAVTVTNELFFDRVHPDDRDAIKKAIAEAIAGRTPYSIEHRIVRPDGSERTVYEHAEIMFRDDGTPSRIIGAVQDVTEQKRIEQALKQNEQFLNAVIENAPAGVSLLGSDGTVLMMNRTGLAMIGADSFDQIQAKNIGQIVADAHRPAFAALVRSVFNGRPGSLEFEAVSLTGRQLWLSTHAVPFYDSRGRVATLLAITVDRTGRKLAEQELRESEERFRALYEQAAIGIELLDLEGQWLRGNGMLGRTLGYSEEELAGLSFTKLTHPDDLPAERSLLRQLLAGQIPSYSIEKRYIHKNGKSMWARVTSSIARTSRPYRISIIEDITERKHAEESLRRSYELMKTIIDSMNDAISLIDVRDFRIVGVNKAFMKEYDYRDEQEVAGKRCYEITHGRADVCEPPDDVCPLLESVRTGEHFSVDHVHYDRQGKKIYMEVSTSPIKDENGKVIQVVHVSRDITERKRAEEDLKNLLAELERSNRELEQFAYVASHDLQEPLRMVASYVQLLERKYQGHLDEKANRYIYFAVDGVKRMQKLIDGLLAFSRVSRGSEFAPVETGKAFSQALTSLGVMIRETNAVVTAGELPRVTGDETQLSQVFQNLIANAIKFRRPDVAPTVQVAAERTATEWVFSVRDNGIGIEPEYYQKIFQIFQRLHTREEYPGTGIGLSLCKRIVERHGGRIWVESEPGKGSAFFFTVSLRSAKGRALAA